MSHCAEHLPGPERDEVSALGRPLRLRAQIGELYGCAKDSDNFTVSSSGIVTRPQRIVVSVPNQKCPVTLEKYCDNGVGWVAVCGVAPLVGQGVDIPNAYPVG